MRCRALIIAAIACTVGAPLSAKPLRNAGADMAQAVGAAPAEARVPAFAPVPTPIQLQWKARHG